MAAEGATGAEAAAARVSRPLLQIAPMMEVTHRDFRYFMRLLTRRAQLWTEMVVDDTILHNLEPEKCDRFLGFHSREHPVVCQLGGSDPAKLAEAAQAVERYGYDEVNLNVGCPSCRVATKGEFGCSLMMRKEVVRDIVHAMSRSVQIPVTVKCRLGVDDLDSPEFTREFVSTVAQGGCKHFVIHARKAWLKGLSPHQNRTIPPLHYPRVLELCRAFPHLEFSVNGGVLDLGHARALLGFPSGRMPSEEEDLVADAWGRPESEPGLLRGEVPRNLLGVMIGRGAMNNPAMLWDVDHVMYGDPEAPAPPTRRGILAAYGDYLREAHPPEEGVLPSVGSVHMATKPVLGLFSGLRGNKAFRVAMDSLMRKEEHREQGPGHVLAEASKVLDEASPGLLDEPLQRTSPYRPRPRGPPGDEAAGPSQQPHQPQQPPRGRKRKAAGPPEGGPLTPADAQAQAPAAAAAAAQSPPQPPEAAAQPAPAAEGPPPVAAAA